MIIGISGKINSGKDTVGKIIQYLTSESGNVNSSRHRNYEEFLSKGGGYAPRNFDHHYQSDWEIKKFADKLKDMVCILLGCTREQLEDREFKEKELGEEWNYTFYNIRDNEGGMLDSHLSQEDAENDLSFWDENINIAHPPCIEKVEQRLTPRLLLQLLGTECGRDIIHPNCWINSLFNDYSDEIIPGSMYQDNGRGEPIDEDDYIPKSKWIITDVRFPNEFRSIKNKGGITIRVNRPNLPESFHLSEISLNSAEFDYTIDNNGTIEELIEKIKNLKIWEDIMTEI